MKKLLGLLFLSMITLTAVWSQEFLMHEETFTWTKDADVCGGYHYWTSYGNAPANMNWKTPYDYQYGQYYFRFEVLDQPTNDPFTLNMCIWTEYDNGVWKEECGGFSPTLAGPGSVVTYNTNIGYQLNGITIDWTDLSKLWRFGICFYIGGHNVGPSIYCTDHPELWSQIDSYMPLKLRVTIVAVAQGYTFSGWNNYVGGSCTPVKQATPSYGIDNANMTTDKAVPSTDEYSYSADMSGAVSGNGQKLALTAGQDVYFRTKQLNDCYLASDIQHLVVPASSCGTPVQQATPAYGIDYAYERTDRVVPATDEYSYSSDMSGSVSGTGTKLTLTPGQNVYFRTKKASDCLLASAIQTLVVPDRPAVPSVSVDFVNESTAENIGSALQYSASSSYTDPVTGNGSKVSLMPGQDLYFWVNVTASSFYSLVTHLVVPERPATPAIAIDFANERTTAVPPSIDISANASMAAATSGTNETVAVSPGTDLYFRTKSTSGSFASLIQHLIVPERPAAPAYSIDFANERTVETVPAGNEYSASPDMTGSVAGADAAIPLTPGNDVFFRVSHTASSFSSEVSHLIVPMRPVLTTEAGDTIQGDFFTAAVDFHGDATGFDASDIDATNASVTLTDPLTIKVVPVATGEISIRVKANAITAGNFASAVFSTYYKEIVSTIPDVIDLKDYIKVYPSPVNNLLTVEAGKNFRLPAEIVLVDGNGVIFIRKTIVSSPVTMDMTDFAHGLYILKAIDASGNVVTGKVIRQ
jgi:hypothetical protein